MQEEKQGRHSSCIIAWCATRMTKSRELIIIGDIILATVFFNGEGAVWQVHNVGVFFGFCRLPVSAAVTHHALYVEW